MILSLQLKYYPAKISELEKSTAPLEALLQHFSFDIKMKEYTDVAMQLSKTALYDIYYNKKRENLYEQDLKQKSQHLGIILCVN